VLWTIIGKELGWKHRRNKKISELFREEKATGAVLQFLRDTDIREIKNGALRPPIPDCDDDGGPVASDREPRRGREYLISLCKFPYGLKRVLWRISFIIQYGGEGSGWGCAR